MVKSNRQWIEKNMAKLLANFTAALSEAKWTGPLICKENDKMREKLPKRALKAERNRKIADEIADVRMTGFNIKDAIRYQHRKDVETYQTRESNKKTVSTIATKEDATSANQKTETKSLETKRRPTRCRMQEKLDALIQGTNPYRHYEMTMEFIPFSFLREVSRVGEVYVVPEFRPSPLRSCPHQSNIPPWKLQYGNADNDVRQWTVTPSGLVSRWKQRSLLGVLPPKTAPLDLRIRWGHCCPPVYDPFEMVWQ